MVFLVRSSILHSCHSPLKVGVVGGGAAGYFAAIQAAAMLKDSGYKDASVVVLEAAKTPLQKVKISGGGRCNVMHDPSKGPKELSLGYPRGSSELIGPFERGFGPTETYKWFSARTPLKTEDDGRVFPTSDQSESIISALKQAAGDAGVDVRCGTNVRGLSRLEAGDGFTIKYTSRAVKTKDDDKATTTQECTVNRLIMATGSARAGWMMLKTLGHTIVDPKPSLFSFKIKDEALNALSGLSIPDATVEVVLSKKFCKDNKAMLRSAVSSRAGVASLRQHGPLLVTHSGLSGPSVLRLSAFGARLLAELDYKFECRVNWMPDLDMQEMISHLERCKDASVTREKQVGTAFPKVDAKAPDARGRLQRRLWNYLLTTAGVEATKRWWALSKAEISDLANVITGQRLQVQGRGQYRDEFVTAGGVESKEIDWKSMQSRVVPGLFVCGEVVNLDGVTGGYNFQSAWTTGFLAGRGAAMSLVGKEPASPG